MLHVKDISIRRKQMLIIMLTSAVVLVLACAAFLTYDALSFRAEMVRNVATTADVIGNNCAAALDFNDPKAAGETLASLKGEPNITAACIYNNEGDLFASYRRDGTNVQPLLTSVKSMEHTFTSQELQLFKPIIVRGETLGTIYLANDLQQLNHRLKSYLGIAALVLALSLLVAFGLSSRLQRVISGPILQLAKMTRKVGSEKNYSLRMAPLGSDELGELVDGFNEMLAEIQARDLELQNARDTLERRVAERTARLEESVSVVNATLESTTNGIMVVDVQGTKILQNQRMIDLWKIPQHVAENPSDAAQVQHVMNMATRPDEFVETVHYFYEHPDESGHDEVALKDGTIMERITAPVLGKDGRNYGRIWTFRDVTQKRQAEKAMRESQALYLSLVNQIPAGIYRKDTEGRYVFVNRWFCTTFGVTPEDCIGKTPMEVAAVDLKNPLKTHLKEAARKDEAQGAIDQHALIIHKGQTLELEEKHILADGSVQYLQVVKTPVFDPTGKIIGSQGIQFEVTQQKQAQMELAYERDLFKALMDNFPDSIYFKDLQSRFVRVSRSKMVRTFHAAADKYRKQHPGEDLPLHLRDEEAFGRYLIGKTDFDFAPKESAETFFRDEQEVIRSGKPLLMNLHQAVSFDGKMNWYLSSRLPWRDSEGKTIGTFGTTKDITVIKEAEAKLEEVHKELLTASRQAGMAEVASNVLHNVGNVLNSVNVSATLAADIARKSKVSSLAKVVDLLDQHAPDLGGFLMRDAKGQQIPGYLRKLYEHLAQEQQTSVAELESLRKNIEHIKDIVSMQQNYAKMSGLKEHVDVADLVEDSLRMNAGALLRHEVVLVREFEPVPTINVEKHKILQILVNLIRNAKYACDEGGPKEKRLTVRIARADELIKISVADNGVGIPSENMMRIFNHGFTTRKTGHGFGLHSGALAAKEMGGRLMVQSDGIGHGATFTLELPIGKDKE